MTMIAINTVVTVTTIVISITGFTLVTIIQLGKPSFLGLGYIGREPPELAQRTFGLGSKVSGLGTESSTLAATPNTSTPYSFFEALKPRTLQNPSSHPKL